MQRTEVYTCLQASAAPTQQLPMPVPSASTSLTNIHLRPQLDQYEDMARFLGYNSSSKSPQDRSNHSQASSKPGLPSTTSSQPPAAHTNSLTPPSSHTGLYPNDHAVDLPASKPFRAASAAPAFVPASAPASAAAYAAAHAADHAGPSVSDFVNPWEGLQQRAASSTGTSSSSSSSHQSHHRSYYSPHQSANHTYQQPQRPLQLQQDQRQHSQQPDRQFVTPTARFAPSPFMADAEHSFVPVAFAPSPFMADAEHSFPTAFAPSPFMADAKHSFVPTPVEDPPQNAWEPFGSPTLPQTDTHSNGNHSSAQTQQAAADYTGNNVRNSPSPPTDYFSYLDLLGAGRPADPPSRVSHQQSLPHHRLESGQFADPQTVSQQQSLLDHRQHQQHRQHHQQSCQGQTHQGRTHQQHSHQGQNRHTHQQDRQQQDRQQQDRHGQDKQQQDRQQQHRHAQDRQQHRQDRREPSPNLDQRPAERNQHQAHAQQRARGGPRQQSSQQPTGTSSDPLPVLGLNYYSAFDSFDDPDAPSGVRFLLHSVASHDFTHQFMMQMHSLARAQRHHSTRRAKAGSKYHSKITTTFLCQQAVSSRTSCCSS